MIKLGIICPSEIAYRRFIPTLKLYKNIEYIGIACANKEEWTENGNISDETYKQIKESEISKAKKFQTEYGGQIFEGYEAMLQSGQIDAVYIPLPPALHYKWAKTALDNNLHVFLEKPSTTSYEDTFELINIAKDKKLAIHENYMFIFHSQIVYINNLVKEGSIGDVRLFRIDFGFPYRGKNDFRYNKSLGGGALLDCGGYTLKYANYLLGGDARIISANSGYKNDCEVDIYGCATLNNVTGQIAQVSFGMDNDYRCNVDIWGSKGSIKSNRILTAPKDFEPVCEIHKNGDVTKYIMPQDDTFLKSIDKFYNCIVSENIRYDEYAEILKQEKLVKDFMEISNYKE